MKNAKAILIAVAIVLGFIVLGNLTKEKDPAYLPHPTTYYGRPAFTQLHRPQNGVQYLTFYRAENAGFNDDPIKDSKYWVMGHEICTVTTELAIGMHYARPGYPKE